MFIGENLRLWEDRLYMPCDPRTYKQPIFVIQISHDTQKRCACAQPHYSATGFLIPASPANTWAQATIVLS